jgi:hypothetical protein
MASTNPKYESKMVLFDRIFQFDFDAFISVVFILPLIKKLEIVKH